MKELPVLSGFPNNTHDSLPPNDCKPIVLIGFQNQGNLGIGYLASTLRKNGYDVEVIDFQIDHELILQRVKSLDPVLVGFSLIFQFYITEFGSLVDRLRDGGIDCHFTMGGHFPSLSYEQALELVPQLDSVVRFEGEITLLELVNTLNQGKDWRGIQGIAYRKDSVVVSNQLRPLIEHLDMLPLPERSFKPISVLGLEIMPLIASRGCSRKCSFCSIHTFYRAVPGKIVRLRQTKTVVDEMKQLYEERNSKIFLFQDDDFPIVGPVWRRWTLEFVDELYRQDLVGKVIWKINCRADVVETELFEILRDAGLYMVYMGLESGSEEGLDVLNKGLSVEQNLIAVSTLKNLGLMFQYGFMMFDPSTTFNSIRENIGFLREITGDGILAATFCRMLPYDGTAIKDQLALEGRLRGDVINPDYDFLDPRLDGLFNEVNETLNIVGWIHGVRSLSPQLDWAWHEVAVAEKMFKGVSDLDFYRDRLSSITRSANELLFNLVEDMSFAHEHGQQGKYDVDDVEFQCKELNSKLLIARDEFVLRNQEKMLQILGVDDQFVSMPRGNASQISAAH
jgi:radical SAM superfamily enzyme YgiQ (UPF0313 family)